MMQIDNWEWTPSDNSHLLGFPVTWGDWGIVIVRPREDLHWVLDRLVYLRIPLESYIYEASW